jgi:hypothetical protein
VALLTGLAVFAGIELLAGLYMQAGRRRDQMYGKRLERLVQQVHATGGTPLSVVMLGSSRTLEGIRAIELNTPLSGTLGRPVVVANFGMSGAGPLSELLNWQRLREDGMRPDFAIIEVVPAFLTDGASDLGEARMPVNRLRRSDLPIFERYASDTRPDIRRSWRAEQFNPLYAHRLTLLSWLAPGLVPTAFLAVPGRSLPEDIPSDAPGLDLWTPELRPKAVAHAREEYFAALQHLRVGGQNCIALRELLKRCQCDRVQAALLVMPEGPVYRSWYATGAYEQVRAWLEALRAEFGIVLIDARLWMASENDFKDSHHLTPDGAARFTQRLGMEGILPLLKNSSTQLTVGPGHE